MQRRRSARCIGQRLPSTDKHLPATLRYDRSSLCVDWGSHYCLPMNPYPCSSTPQFLLETTSGSVPGIGWQICQHAAFWSESDFIMTSASPQDYMCSMVCSCAVVSAVGVVSSLCCIIIPDIMQEEVIHMKLEDDETYEAPEPGEIVDEPEGKPVSGPVLSAPPPSPLPSLETLIKPRQDLVPQQRTFPLPSSAVEQSNKRSERGVCSRSRVVCCILSFQSNCKSVPVQISVHIA